MKQKKFYQKMKIQNNEINLTVKIVLMFLFLLGMPLGLHADETVPMALSIIEKGDTRASLRLKVNEILYVKLNKGYLAISVDNLKSQNKKEIVSESCLLKITHVESDRITKKSLKSFIVYSAELRNNQKHLKVVDGTQEHRIAGIEIGWSYASKDTIFFYMPANIKFAVLHD